MHLRKISWSVLLVSALLVGVGCRRSDPQAHAEAAGLGSRIAQVHWLGKKRIAAQKQADHFMAIWNIPEAKVLEQETITKLALAPWSISEGWKTNRLSATNEMSERLRPLAEDLVREEVYVEIQQPNSNSSHETVFAVRLSSARAELWNTNLAIVIQSLTGARTSTNSIGFPGWALKRPNSPELVQLTRFGEWTLVGLAEGTNSLLGEFRKRIQRAGIPFEKPTTNFWLTFDADLARLNKVLKLGLPLPESSPRVHLTWIGEKDFVRTRGEFVFAKRLNLPLTPWSVPTNLIREPIVSFTAVRGMAPLLEGQRFLQDSGVNPVPNQAFVWALSSSPVHMYSAAPLTGASNLLAGMSTNLSSRINQLLEKHSRGTVDYSPRHNGFTWVPMPFVTPTLHASSDGKSEYVIARLSAPLLADSNTVPGELFSRINSKPNVLYYDWEMTRDRLMQWVFLAQSARIIFWFPQIPQGSSVLAFMQAAAGELGNCVTELEIAGPNTINFLRRSDMGFTAIEFQILSDWLASPQFPWGLNSLTAPRLPKPTASTNFVPSSITIPVK